MTSDSNPLLQTQNNADKLDAQEPLLTPSLKRFVILPIEYHDVRSKEITSLSVAWGPSFFWQGSLLPLPPIPFPFRVKG